MSCSDIKTPANMTIFICWSWNDYQFIALNRFTMSMILHHLSIFGPLNALKIIGSDSLNEPGQKTKDPLRVMVAWCRWGPNAHCSKCTLLVFNDFLLNLQTILKTPEGELIRQIYEAMRDDPIPGVWSEQVKCDFEKVNPQINSELLWPW